MTIRDNIVYFYLLLFVELVGCNERARAPTTWKLVKCISNKQRQILSSGTDGHTHNISSAFNSKLLMTFDRFVIDNGANVQNLQLNVDFDFRCKSTTTIPQNVSCFHRFLALESLRCMWSPLGIGPEATKSNLKSINNRLELIHVPLHIFDCIFR